MEIVRNILARLLHTGPTGLDRAKALSQKGMDFYGKDLTLDTMHDKVCSITDDKEQEQISDYENYATQKELPF